MNEQKTRFTALLLPTLGLGLSAWSVAGLLLLIVETMRQGHLSHGHDYLVLWEGARIYRDIVPHALAGTVLLALLFALLCRLPSGRRALFLRVVIVVSAIAALLRFGYRLNRFALAGFWKEARNAGGIPVGWETARPLAANGALLLLVFFLALLLERFGRGLLDGDGGKRPRVLRARTWILLLLVPAAVFAGAALLRPDASGRPNVLLIAFDTTRSDHLTLSGYPRETAPHTTRLAAEGTLFAETVSQAPWTLSSFASMMTGLYPSTHGAYIGTKERLLRRDYVPYLAERYVTLSEVFRNAGYTTVCEAANTYLRFGLDQGYDRCRVELRPAGPTADALLAVLEKRGGTSRPFFAFLHFNDAHMPNVPPAPFDRVFPTTDGRPHTNEEKWEWRYTNGEGLSGDSFTDFREHKVAIYDGCLRYMDDQVGKVLAWLDANGLADNTIVGIVTDHGEEFWDHAEVQAKSYHDPRGMYGVGHGHTLFDEQLRLLLVLRGPGVPRGKIVPSRVRAIDIEPTLLELAGLPPPKGVEGNSLGPLLRGSEEGDRASIAEGIIYGSDRRAIVRDGYKYVYSPDEPRFLFDLATDPGEKTNLIDREPARAEQMRREIEAWISIRSGRGPAVQSAIDKKTLEELKALGYVE